VATCSDEAQLKRSIVLAIQRALPARRLQQVAPHRVGLEEPDGTPSTCFMLVSSSWLMHEVLKMLVIQVK
jgi:hypothetical protein